MARFHINPETGDVGPCRAMVSCPFGDLETDHYDSKAKAMKAYEARMAETSFTPKADGPRYTMPARRLQEAIASIDKANRKAERAGIKERFTYSVETWTKESVDELGYTVFEERAAVTLNRPVVKHEGWTFAGTMTWDEEAGLITRMAPGQELIERPEAELCDVCKTVRHRNDTYIVQKDGEQKQVGSNCLKRFMGIAPASLWMMDFEVPMKEGADEERLSYGESFASMRRSSQAMVGLGLAIAEEHGWLSKSQAYNRADGSVPTVNRVEAVLMNKPTTDVEKRAFDRLRARGKELEAEAHKVLLSAASMEGDSEYAENMRLLAKTDTVNGRNLPLLLSAIGNYRREQDREARQASAATSEWVGTEGERLSGQTLTVESIKTIESNFGTSRLIVMKDEDGNRMKTFYSGSDEVSEGATYTLKGGTVKKHEEWQGAKETVLSRVKLTPSTATPKPAPKETTTYGEASTVEELEGVYRRKTKAIREDMKEKAGLNGWDNALNRPHDPQLEQEWRALMKVEDEAFDKQYTTLTEES